MNPKIPPTSLPDPDKPGKHLLSELSELRARVADLQESKLRSEAAEDALKESEWKFRAIFDQTFQFIGLLATDGTLLEANRSALDFIGARESDVTGKPFWETPWWTHSKEIQEKLRWAVGRAAKGEFVRYETSHLAADGSLHFIDFSLKPATNGSGHVVMLIAEGRDITARKRVEEAVSNSEAKFKALFENAGPAIFVADVETGKIIDCNSNAESLIGYARGEIIGMHQTLLHPIVDEEEHRANFIRHSRLCRLINFETDIQHRDGRRIPVMISATPLTMGGQKTMIGCFMDISARKKIEKELMEAKSEAELYLDLMGHDINNLNQIGMGFLELAIDTLDLDEKGHGMLLKPLNAFENSSRLIDNVRKLQKVKTGDVVGKDMDIGQVLTDVIGHYRQMHGDAAVNYIPVVGHVVHASELLYDVFSNLVSNAIKHSGGPPHISIRLEKVLENGGYYSKVSVEDHGPGIPDDFKKVIFTRQLQGGQKAKGSGIGLFLVKTLVDDYGGRIWVEDRIPGDRSNGSRFVVMLPAVDADHPA